MSEFWYQVGEAFIFGGIAIILFHSAVCIRRVLKK
jgi:hypothetical protein